MTKQIDVDAMLDKVIERVKEIAEDGIAPSYRKYNKNRGDLCLYETLRMHGISWDEIARMAGLQPASARFQTQRSVGVPAALEAEIRKHFQDGDQLPSWRREWPLTVIPTALEVREFLLPDGRVYRLTRAYASIR